MFARIRFLAVAAAMLAVGTDAYAQTPGTGIRTQRRERARAFIASYLGLTESQKAQAKDVLDAARTQAAPVAAQLKQGHVTLRDAVKAGKSDAELDALAREQGALMGQLAAIHAKSFAKLYPMLTPEQQDKLDHLREMAMLRLGRGAPNRL